MITSDVLILHVNSVIKEADNFGPRSLNKQRKYGTSKMPIIEQQLSLKHHTINFQHDTCIF